MHGDKDGVITFGGTLRRGVGVDLVGIRLGEAEVDEPGYGIGCFVRARTAVAPALGVHLTSTFAAILDIGPNGPADIRNQRIGFV
jgi:hypothetical protein